MELIQDWRVFHQWLREPALRAASASTPPKGDDASLSLSGPLLVVVENSEAGPLVLACIGAERGGVEDFSAGLGLPLGDWLDRVGSGRAIHVIEASRLWRCLEDAPGDLTFLGQIQWLLEKLEFREVEDGESARIGRTSPFLKRWLSLPVRPRGTESGSGAGRPLESLLDGRADARFLESFSGWARRFLPRSFALMIRLEEVAGAVDGRTQALPRDAVFVFKDGELGAAFEPDLSSVGLERRLDLGSSLQVLQERWMIPVFGLKANEAEWVKWLETADPWAGVRSAIRKGEARLLPEGTKNPLWLVLQSRTFSL